MQQHLHNEKMERPMGVTILAVLYVLSGLVYLSFPLVMTSILGEFWEVTGLFLTLCWVVFGAFALIAFVTAYGLWNGKGWARMIAIVLAIIQLINIPIGTIIGIIILIYLFKDDVKAYFGEGTGKEQNKTCLSCGQQIDVRYSVCPYCGQNTAPKQQQYQQPPPPQEDDNDQW